MGYPIYHRTWPTKPGAIGNERRGLFVRFGVSKQNYDATPLDRWYQRHTGGVLLPVELQEIKRESGNKGGKGYDSAAY